MELEDRKLNFPFSISKQERLFILKATKLVGKKFSPFVRQAALDAAAEIIKQHEQPAVEQH